MNTIPPPEHYKTIQLEHVQLTICNTEELSMKTNCQIAYQNHRDALKAEHERFQKEINQMAVEEFPDGTPVSWLIPGQKKPVTGTVTGRISTETASIMVWSDGGMGNTVRAWELTKINHHERS